MFFVELILRFFINNAPKFKKRTGPLKAKSRLNMHYLNKV